MVVRSPPAIKLPSHFLRLVSRLPDSLSLRIFRLADFRAITQKHLIATRDHDSRGVRTSHSSAPGGKRARTRPCGWRWGPLGPWACWGGVVGRCGVSGAGRSGSGGVCVHMNELSTYKLVAPQSLVTQRLCDSVLCTALKCSVRAGSAVGAAVPRSRWQCTWLQNCSRCASAGANPGDATRMWWARDAAR